MILEEYYSQKEFLCRHIEHMRWMDALPWIYTVVPEEADILVFHIKNEFNYTEPTSLRKLAFIKIFAKS